MGYVLQLNSKAPKLVLRRVRQPELPTLNTASATVPGIHEREKVVAFVSSSLVYGWKPSGRCGMLVGTIVQCQGVRLRLAKSQCYAGKACRMLLYMCTKPDSCIMMLGEQLDMPAMPRTCWGLF